jgi:hypothetical protein
MYHHAGVPALFLRFRNITGILAVVLGVVPLKGIAQTCGISVPTTIVDATTGKFIPSIEPIMVHAKINKTFIQANSVDRIRSFRVLLLVDASGSMSRMDIGSPSRQRDTVQKLKEMLDENLYSFPPGVQVSFGVFNKQIAFANEFTSDPDRLHHLIPETISRLKSPGTGQTSLFDAIHGALEQFGSVKPGDTILLVTDGGENNSKQISEKSLANELSGRAVRLFALLVQDRSPSSPEETVAIPVMSELAERSGGAVRIYATDSLGWGDKKRLQSAKDELQRFWNEEVLSAYLVRFTIPDGIRKEQKWLLAVDPSANGGKKMAAGSPSRLEPCPVTTATR